MTVSNPKFELIEPQTHTKEFKTGFEPVLAYIAIEPDKGFTEETDFEVTLKGFAKSPNQPLSFVLYGVLSEDPISEYILTEPKVLDENLLSHVETL